MRKRITSATAMGILALACGGVDAATWAVDAAGNWNTPGNWSGGVPKLAGEQADVAVDVSAARIVTIDTAVSLGTLTLGDTNAGNGSFGITVTRSGSNVLTMDNGTSLAVIGQLSTSAGDTISTPFTLNSDLEIYNAAAGKVLLINNTVTTNGRTITIGSATNPNVGMVATNNNNFLAGNPDLIVHSGTFALGTTNNRNNTLGSLTVNAGATAGGASYTINGAGSLVVNGTLNASIVTGTGGVTLGGGGLINVASTASKLLGDLTFSGGAGATLTGNGTRSLDMNGATRTVTVADGSSAVDLTVGANSSNSIDLINGGIIKTGAGVMQLTARSTVNVFSYAGNTTINQGTLSMFNNGSSTIKNLIPNSPMITVAAGATLDVSGVANNGFIFGAGQTLQGRGSVVGNLMLNGTLAVDVEADADPLAVTGTVNVGSANLQVAYTSGLELGDVVFVLANDDTDAIVAPFARLNGVAADLSQGAMFELGDAVFQISYTANSEGETPGNDVAMTVTAVPEPATAGLLLAAAALLGRRRRKFNGRIDAQPVD